MKIEPEKTWLHIDISDSLEGLEDVAFLVLNGVTFASEKIDKSKEKRAIEEKQRHLFNIASSLREEIPALCYAMRERGSPYEYHIRMAEKVSKDVNESLGALFKAIGELTK